MRTRHTILAEIEYKFRFPGLEPGEHETAYPKVEITYSFIKGRPAYTPRGEYGPIDPPDPPEVGFISATMVDADGMEFPPAKVDEIASDWLDGDGWELAVRNAEDDR